MTKIKGRGQTDQDIIRTIGYITDDKFIASYYGVDVRRVNQLRNQESERKTKVDAVQQVKQSEHGRPAASSLGLNSDSERKWNANAKKGSAALLAALNKFFENRERRIRMGEAP